LSGALLGGKAGDKMRLRISRGGAEQDVEATLAANVNRNYKLSQMPDATPAQVAILRDWLRAAEGR